MIYYDDSSVGSRSRVHSLGWASPPWNWSSMIKAFYLCAYARQPARGPTMWAHFVAILAYVGLSCGQCGPMLWLCWPHVDSCWAKRSEKWEQQRNTVKRRVFWWSAAYLGAMLAHLGAMLAYLEGNVGRLGYQLEYPAFCSPSSLYWKITNSFFVAPLFFVSIWYVG